MTLIITFYLVFMVYQINVMEESSVRDQTQSMKANTGDTRIISVAAHEIKG